VNVVTGLDPFNTGFLEGAFGIARPNLVLGVPLYLESGAPGGKIINAAAFSIPATGQGDLGRNALSGFGATQFELTLRTLFRLTERVSLQARGDLFNIFNHPNFGNEPYKRRGRLSRRYGPTERPCDRGGHKFTIYKVEPTL
jgi:hypothetical protein